MQPETPRRSSSGTPRIPPTLLFIPLYQIVTKLVVANTVWSLVLSFFRSIPRGIFYSQALIAATAIAGIPLAVVPWPAVRPAAAGLPKRTCEALAARETFHTTLGVGNGRLQLPDYRKIFRIMGQSSCHLWKNLLQSPPSAAERQV